MIDGNYEDAKNNVAAARTSLQVPLYTLLARAVPHVETASLQGPGAIGGTSIGGVPCHVRHICSLVFRF